MWRRLDPWPDAVAGITRLKRRFTVVPLSNGNIGLLTAMAKKRGRQRVFSDAPLGFCLSIKCLLGARLSTVSRRQKTLQVHLPCRASTWALDLLVDSAGTKFLGEGEWTRKKHGAEYRRQWRKVHLGVDAKTLGIRAIEVTDHSVGDAPTLPEWLGQIPSDEPMGSVSADSAYDKKARHAATVERGTQRLEDMERISPQESGGDQDAWLQALGRAGDGTHH